MALRRVRVSPWLNIGRFMHSAFDLEDAMMWRPLPKLIIEFGLIKKGVSFSSQVDAWLWLRPLPLNLRKNAVVFDFVIVQQQKDL